MTPRRFLLVSRKPPSPGIGGSSMRLYQHIRTLSRQGEVGVFWVSIDNTPPPARPDGISYWKHLSLPLVPGGVLRMLKGFLTSTPCADLFWTNDAGRHLRNTLREFKPDTVIISEAWLAHYLPVIRQSGARVIFDMHNVELPLYRSIAPSARGMRRIHATLLLRTSRTIEPRMIRGVDAAWVCSTQDELLTRATYDTGLPIHVIPNAIDIDHYADVRANRLQSEAPMILYCGNFTYYPNAEAAERLITRILPVIWAVNPSVRLTLVGNHPTRLMQEAAHRDPRITVTGFVDDVRHWLTQATVTVLPIRQGGGTRLKVLESFAARIPVIATHKAVEGIHAQDGEHVLIADDDQGLADKALLMITSKNLADAMTGNALSLARDHYSLDTVSELMFRVLSGASSGKADELLESGA